MRVRVDGVRDPVLAAAGVRADGQGAAGVFTAGDEAAVHRLLAGLGIDFCNEVLYPQLEGIQVLARLRVHGIEDAGLVAGHHHVPLQAVHRQVQDLPLVTEVHVPLVIGQVLVIPGQLAGIGVYGQGAVGIQGVVGDAGHAHRVAQGGGIVGRRGAEEGQVGLRVVTAGHPEGTAGAFLQRHAVPGIAAVLARARDAVETPGLLAGIGIQGHHVAAAGAAVGAGDAGHDLAAYGHRPAGEVKALVDHAYGTVPDHLAGLRIQRHHVQVGGAEIDPVTVQRDGLLPGGVHRLGQAPLVMPQLVTGQGVEGLHVVAETLHEQHAVMEQRRGFVGARRQGQRPGQLQVFHVAAVDLLKRAETLAVQGTAPAGPLARRRIDQHLIGHRGIGIQRVGMRRPGRQLGVGTDRPARPQAHALLFAQGSAGHEHGLQSFITVRQRRVARLHVVLLQEVGQQGGQVVMTDAAGVGRRHVGAYVIEQVRQRLAGPASLEVVALERGPELAALHGLAVAGGAVVLELLLALLRLRRGEYRIGEGG